MDLKILFTTRIVRLFCYGFLSLILALYLAQVGLTGPQIGLLFSLTLAGDAAVSLWLTTSADRFGRRRTLLIGALLMLGAGRVFILTNNIVLLRAAAIGGVILQSMIAYCFHIKFGVETGLLGSLFFGANILAGMSALLAVPLVRRFG